MTIDEMIAAVEANGYRVTPEQDHPDEDLRRNWHGFVASLKIAHDRATSGAVLHLGPPFLPQWSDATVIGLLRNGVVNMVDEIIATAVVDRRETIDAE